MPARTRQKKPVQQPAVIDYFAAFQRQLELDQCEFLSSLTAHSNQAKRDIQTLFSGTPLSCKVNESQIDNSTFIAEADDDDNEITFSVTSDAHELADRTDNSPDFSSSQSKRKRPDDAKNQDTTFESTFSTASSMTSDDSVCGRPKRNAAKKANISIHAIHDDEHKKKKAPKKEPTSKKKRAARKKKDHIETMPDIDEESENVGLTPKPETVELRTILGSVENKPLPRKDPLKSASKNDTTTPVMTRSAKNTPATVVLTSKKEESAKQSTKETPKVTEEVVAPSRPATRNTPNPESDTSKPVTRNTPVAAPETKTTNAHQPVFGVTCTVSSHPKFQPKVQSSLAAQSPSQSQVQSPVVHTKLSKATALQSTAVLSHASDKLPPKSNLAEDSALRECAVKVTPLKKTTVYNTLMDPKKVAPAAKPTFFKPIVTASSKTILAVSENQINTTFDAPVAASPVCHPKTVIPESTFPESLSSETEKASVTFRSDVLLTPENKSNRVNHDTIERPGPSTVARNISSKSEHELSKQVSFVSSSDLSSSSSSMKVPPSPYVPATAHAKKDLNDICEEGDEEEECEEAMDCLPPTTPKQHANPNSTRSFFTSSIYSTKGTPASNTTLGTTFNSSIMSGNKSSKKQSKIVSGVKSFWSNTHLNRPKVDPASKIKEQEETKAKQIAEKQKQEEERVRQLKQKKLEEALEKKKANEEKRNRVKQNLLAAKGKPIQVTATISSQPKIGAGAHQLAPSAASTGAPSHRFGHHVGGGGSSSLLTRPLLADKVVPVHKIVPAIRREQHNYAKMEFLDGGDSDEDQTDDESAPRHKVPSWACRSKTYMLARKSNKICRKMARRRYLRVETADLSQVFQADIPRYRKRTSSAYWGRVVSAKPDDSLIMS